MHIMLVADKPTEAIRLQEWLCTGLGSECKVTHLDSMNEALIQMQAYPGTVDVLVLDLIIPPDDRQMFALSEAKKRAPLMAIVVVSELGDNDVVRTAIRSGAHEFEVKSSLDAQSLAMIVNRVVQDRRRMAKDLQAAQTGADAAITHAIVVCEVSPLAVELLARKARELGKTTRETLDDLIRESFAPPIASSAAIEPTPGVS